MVIVFGAICFILLILYQAPKVWKTDLESGIISLICGVLLPIIVLLFLFIFKGGN